MWRAAAWSFVLSRFAALVLFPPATIAANMAAATFPAAAAAQVVLPVFLRRWRPLFWLATLWAAMAAFITLRRHADLFLPWRWEYAAVADRLLGFGALPTVRFQSWFAGPVFEWTASAIYLTLFFVPPAVAAVLALRQDGLAARYVLAIIVLYALALIGHVLVPTVPPWMASDAGIIETVDRMFYRVVYGISVSWTDQGYQASANDVAAMPSVHVGLTAAASFAIAAASRRLSAVAFAYLALMCWAIVYLGEHYLVDALAGATCAAVGWWAGGRIASGGSPSPAPASIGQPELRA